MPMVRLIHWNESEALERADRLRTLGYRVVAAAGHPVTGRALMEDPPDAVVIDLSRLPSHGRAVGVVLRQTKSTRHLPLIFVDGEPEKVEPVKRLLPDAAYTTWARIKPELRRALASPPVTPHVPKAGHTEYPHSPLPKKLGIKEGMSIALVGAPANFGRTLGAVPKGARLIRSARPADLVVWFTKSRADFDRRLRSMARLAKAGGLWVAYPKQAAKMKTDLTQQHIRETAIAAGLVDWKICAINETWSGLRFARKKPKK